MPDLYTVNYKPPVAEWISKMLSIYPIICLSTITGTKQGGTADGRLGRHYPILTQNNNYPQIKTDLGKCQNKIKQLQQPSGAQNPWMYTKESEGSILPVSLHPLAQRFGAQCDLQPPSTGQRTAGGPQQPSSLRTSVALAIHHQGLVQTSLMPTLTDRAAQGPCHCAPLEQKPML